MTSNYVSLLRLRVLRGFLLGIMVHLIRLASLFIFIVLLVVSSVGSAAPTKVRYPLTGGDQWAYGPIPTFTSNGNPIATGQVTITRGIAPGCPDPPVSGTSLCIRALSFRTYWSQTWNLAAPLSMPYHFTNYSFSHFNDTQGIRYTTYAYTPDCRYVLDIQAENHSLLPVTTPPTTFVPRPIHLYQWTCPETGRGLYKVTGHEIQVVPSIDQTGRLAIAVSLFATPFVVIILRRRAARANRRSS